MSIQNKVESTLECSLDLSGSSLEDFQGFIDGSKSRLQLDFSQVGAYPTNMEEFKVDEENYLYLLLYNYK